MGKVLEKFKIPNIVTLITKDDVFSISVANYSVSGANAAFKWVAGKEIRKWAPNAT